MSQIKFKRSEPTIFLREPNRKFSVFWDHFKYQDDIHGKLFLSQLERDVIDTPEFQRLFEISQMGFIGRVFRGANHTRGHHCIGVNWISKFLIDTINSNSKRIAMERKDDYYRISFSESVVICLAALLHDIPHGPFSHDIEAKNHLVLLDHGQRRATVQSEHGRYPKHDDWARNPALYVALLDANESHMARVLRAYSPLFLELLIEEIASKEVSPKSKLKDFVELLPSWPEAKDELLPALIFHLLVFEKSDDARNESILAAVDFNGNKVQWGLGPTGELRQKLHRNWYQPFRHDVVGNTLSADLIDYLLRDRSRLGLSKEIDLTLCEFYVLAQIQPGSSSFPGGRDGLFGNVDLFRCVIDLIDYKRGTIRELTINQIFRLLESRFEVHEKAVAHRVTQSLACMLSRAVQLLGTQRPPLAEIYGVDRSRNIPTLRGDSWFLQKLISGTHQNYPLPRNLVLKIAERRVHRPLLIIPGSKLAKHLDNNEMDAEAKLRVLAAIVESRYFSSFFLYVSSLIENYLDHAIRLEELQAMISAPPLQIPISPRVIFSTSPYRSLFKNPEIMLRFRNDKDGLVSIEKAENEAVLSIIKPKLEDSRIKYESLWRFYVFISDGLYYTSVLSKINPEETPVDHVQRLRQSQTLAIVSLDSAFTHFIEHLRENPDALNSECSGEKLKVLLTDLALAFDTHIPTFDLVSQLSNVKVEQYYHGEEDSVISGNCRDIRYKFHVRSGWHLPEDSNTCILLKRLKINVDSLSESDLQHLDEKFGKLPEVEQLLTTIPERPNRTESKRIYATLCSLWAKRLTGK